MTIDKEVVNIDAAFFDYLSGKGSIKDLEKKLSLILSKSIINGGTKKYTVSVTNTNSKEPFFGMRVYPMDPTVISKYLVCDMLRLNELIGKWNELKEFYIEIDFNVFNRTEINLNPKELTALLLHEVTHTVYSDSVITRLYTSYKNQYVEMKEEEKKSLEIMHILYSTAVVSACGDRYSRGAGRKVKKIIRTERSIDERAFKEELACDRALGIPEYANYLVSALSKIIAAYGNSEVMTADKGVDQTIDWCNLNAKDLVRRKDALKDELAYKTLRTSSGFLKSLYFKILHSLGVGLQERYSGSIMECTLENMSSMEEFAEKYIAVYNPKIINNYIDRYRNITHESVMESFSKKNNNKPMLPSEYDIDIIGVEIDRITNHNDRKYILDLIYSKIEQINTYLEYIDDDAQLKRRYGPRAQKMLKQLNKYREIVLDKHVVNSTYKVFVKVPEGYEG